MLAEDTDEGTRKEENGFGNFDEDQKISKTDSGTSKISNGKQGIMEPIQEEDVNIKGKILRKITLTLSRRLD